MTMASVQNNTSNGSIVIKMEPTLINGALVMMSSSRHACRAPASRAMNRSITRLKIAAMTGEKNLTPNCVSPHSHVPRNWV